MTSDDCELLNCCFNNTGYFEPQCFYNNLTDVGILEWNARTQVCHGHLNDLVSIFVLLVFIHVYY